MTDSAASAQGARLGRRADLVAAYDWLPQSRRYRAVSLVRGRRFLGGASRGEDRAGKLRSPDRRAPTEAFAERQQSQDRGNERLGEVQSGNCGSGSRFRPRANSR